RAVVVSRLGILTACTPTKLAAGLPGVAGALVRLVAWVGFAGFAGLSQNLAPTPIPTAMNTRATQPSKLKRLVSTMPLPTVQPPGRDAPTPLCITSAN